MFVKVLTVIWLCLISISDIRTRNVPVLMLAAGGILVIPEVIRGEYSGMLLGLVPGLMLLAIAFGTKKAGYGDGIVLLLLGIVSGGGKGLMIFGAALFLAAVCSMVLLALRKVGRDTRIPFLPFLTVAWLAVMIF